MQHTLELIIWLMFYCLYVLEKLTGQKLDVPEVTQSEENQKQKLRIVLGCANRVIKLCDQPVH